MRRREPGLDSQGSQSSIAMVCLQSCHIPPATSSLCMAFLIVMLVLALLERSWRSQRVRVPCCFAWSIAGCLPGCIRQIVLSKKLAVRLLWEAETLVSSVPVSPASPENAMSECVFSTRVLSSEALRMVAPRIAALDAAMRVKSLPVIPSKTSLNTVRVCNYAC